MHSKIIWIFIKHNEGFKKIRVSRDAAKIINIQIQMSELLIGLRLVIKPNYKH